MKILSYPRFKAFKDDNSPAVGWKVYSYASGTTTPQSTYTDQAGAAANTNPVILDGSGEASIWLDPSLAYRIILTDENDAYQRTVEGIQVLDDGAFDALTAASLLVSGAAKAGSVESVGQIKSDVATGTAPLVIASTTKVANLNVDKLDDADWAAPPAIGSGTPAAGSFTTLAASGTLSVTGNATKNANDIQQSANGAQWVRGQISEEITLSTSGTTTDSVADLLPANSVIEGVVARVTQAITTATDWKLGDATTAGRFTAAQATTQLNLGATVVGLVHRDPAAVSAAGPQQAAAAKLRVTTTGTPGAGKIRVTVFYSAFVAPTT